MARTKTKSWWDLNPQPHRDVIPVSQRGGCKVGWKTYADEAVAREIAEWAGREGNHKATLGYDYGYCCPGSVEKVPDGWEVCFA